MRRVCLVLIALAAPARADGPVPIVIQPFRARCFDAAGLAERVRARVPEAAVSVGGKGRGGHQVVRVETDGESLRVDLIVRGGRGRMIGSERRWLPAGGDCAVLADTVALIVARAATPLGQAAPEPRPNRPRPAAAREAAAREAAAREAAARERETAAREAAAREAAAREAAAREAAAREAAAREAAARETAARETAVRETAARETAARETAARETAARETAAHEATARELAARQAAREAARRPAVPAPAGDPTTVTAARPPGPHHQLEIDAGALWSFPLDGPPSAPGGELAVGWRWRRLGVGLRGGVSGDWSVAQTTNNGPVTIHARRVPLAAELRLDFAVPRARGVVRLAAGPTLILWWLDSTGLPHAGATTVAQPGLFVRAAYRLELGPMTLGVGLDADVVFVYHSLQVGGVGELGRTPVIQLSPFLTVGVGFL